MPQDAFTLKRVANELNTLLAGAKVNRIVQPAADEIVLTTYGGGKTTQVIASANAVGARVGTIKDDRPAPLTAPGFCMLLRKYLTNARVESVRLLDGERIVEFAFCAVNDFFEDRPRALYAEIMGKYSNLVLTEENRILGCLKPFNLQPGSLRPLLPGMQYALPPKQDKFLCGDRGFAEWVRGRAEEYGGELSETELAALFFEKAAGLSAVTAGEIARRFVEKYGTFDGLKTDDLYAFTRDFWDTSEFSPNMTDAGKKGGDFYAFDYRSVKEEKTFYPSLLSAQEAFYAKKEFLRVFGDEKRKLLSVVKKADDKLKKRAKIIAAKEEDAATAEKNRLYGELLIANLYRVPAGASEVTLENFYDDFQPVTVRLDAALSAKKNAEAYFKRYNKQKRTLAALAPQKEELEKERAYVESLYAEIGFADSLSLLADAEEELKAAGLIRAGTAKKKKEKKAGVLTYAVYGYPVLVGKNNLANDELTFSAEGGDLWLHVKGYHSAHVIVKTGGSTPPEKVILAAAEICAYYSQAKDAGKVQVDYALKKHVKKPRGANPGFVTYEGQSSVFVTANKHEDLLKAK